MNKAELISAISKQADLSKAQATKAINCYHEIVKKEIKAGNSVGVVGFGTFTSTERKERSGRNPQTGAALTIKAAKVPKFRPGKALRDSI
ncbi:MAG TPA: DNA-binding protein HU [Prolixibacteraceae bacterium]|nr:DNA-binding protein HU [Prolixibacteraceae bacterium]